MVPIHVKRLKLLGNLICYLHGLKVCKYEKNKLTINCMFYSHHEL